ncbi:MAG: calcium-binding protein, partial [Gammaproteobacteria bacterium]
NALDLTAAGGQIGAGGAGNDVYRVNSTADAVVELGNGGRDRVEANVNWVLWDNVEDLRFTGGNAVSGWGNELGNRMEGNGAANQLKGYGGNDTLFGASGADRLDGGDGTDVLRGGAGNDVLTGGAATDTFLFDAALSGNKDTISDFVPGTDRLQLDNDVFTALGTLGALAPLQFVAGANLKAAQDADDRIVYDTSTGTLYYDADGKGGAAAVAFAVLSGSPSIAAGDILIGD